MPDESWAPISTFDHALASEGRAGRGGVAAVHHSEPEEMERIRIAAELVRQLAANSIELSELITALADVLEADDARR